MELQLPWCSSVLWERVKSLQAPAHLSSKGGNLILDVKATFLFMPFSKNLLWVCFVGGWFGSWIGREELDLWSSTPNLVSVFENDPYRVFEHDHAVGVYSWQSPWQTVPTQLRTASRDDCMGVTGTGLLSGGDTCGCTDPLAFNWFRVPAYGCNDAWRHWEVEVIPAQERQGWGTPNIWVYYLGKI